MMPLVASSLASIAGRTDPALVLFGGPVLYSFSVASCGVSSCTYSSIWIACAGLVSLKLWPEQLQNSEEKGEKAKQ
jgi:preprotein translocase subunit SecF